MFKVSIVRDESPSRAVSEAISLIGGVGSFFDPEDYVLIKPNVCGGVPGKAGTYTRAEVVSSVIALLKGEVKKMVVGEADSSMYGADRMLRETGVKDLAEEMGFELVNLSKGEMEEVEVEGGLAARAIRVSRVLTEATKIVSIPVAKTHTTTDVTLSLKNMFGILAERKKAKFHSRIDLLITDIVKAFPPSLCVVDATTALEGQGPFHGDPVDLDLIVAGDNAVATDAVMASVMGYKPERIEHLRLASERGLGPVELGDIEILGEDLSEVRREFKRAPREPLSRPLSRIPGLGYLLCHYYYESAVKAWKRTKRRSKEG